MKLTYGWTGNKFVMLVGSDEQEPDLASGTVLHRISVTEAQLNEMIERIPQLKKCEGFMQTIENHQQLR